MIGHGAAPVSPVKVKQVIPGSTRRLAPGQQPLVRVQHHVILARAEGPQDFLLPCGWHLRAAAAPGLRAWQKRLPQTSFLAARRQSGASPRLPACETPRIFARGVHPVLEWGHNRRKVSPAPARNRLPLCLAGDGQEPVVVEKSKQGHCREFLHRPGCAGPDGCRHGLEVQFPKFRAELPFIQKLTELQASGNPAAPESSFASRLNLLISRNNFHERALSTFCLCAKNPFAPPARIFKSGLPAAHCKGHIRIDPGNLQFRQQTDEIEDRSGRCER